MLSGIDRADWVAAKGNGMSETRQLRARRKDAERSRDAFVSGEGNLVRVRDEVLSSWRRTAAVLSPQVVAAPLAPATYDPAALLHSVHALDGELWDSIRASHAVVALADPHGRIVWTTGERKLLRLAEQANFAPGTMWDEAHMGTNAISLALTSDNPATVWAAEHWSCSLHCWSCYSAPVRHPQDGTRLGVLNFSTTWDQAHPLASTAVIALAQRLGVEIAAYGSPCESAEEPGLALRVLGAPAAWVDGVPVILTRRQTEIVLLLALHPGGIALEALHADLYGDARVGLGTLKAELSHLRRIVGGRISRAPYRLRADVDALALLDDVRDGRVRDAVAKFTGPLLPWSSSPRIVRLARTVEVAVRGAVLASTDPEPAVALALALPDDLELAEHALALLPAADGRRHILAGQVDASA